MAQVLLKYYNGTQPGQPIGVFKEPSIYWWESSAVWGDLIDYWNYTADTQHNGLVQQALLAQVGPDKDHMVPKQTTTEVRE